MTYEELELHMFLIGWKKDYKSEHPRYTIERHIFFVRNYPDDIARNCCFIYPRGNIQKKKGFHTFRQALEYIENET